MRLYQCKLVCFYWVCRFMLEWNQCTCIYCIKLSLTGILRQNIHYCLSWVERLHCLRFSWLEVWNNIKPYDCDVVLIVSNALETMAMTASPSSVLFVSSLYAPRVTTSVSLMLVTTCILRLNCWWWVAIDVTIVVDVDVADDDGVVVVVEV